MIEGTSQWALETNVHITGGSIAGPWALSQERFGPRRPGGFRRVLGGSHATCRQVGTGKRALNRRRGRIENGGI